MGRETILRRSAMSLYSTHSRATMMLLLVVLLVVSLITPAAAQERFGSVSGVVKDPSGAVVPDVTVTVKNKETNRTLTTKTRNDGGVLVSDLEPGRYTVQFEKPGFSRSENNDVMVLVGRAAIVEASMKIGGG